MKNLIIINADQFCFPTVKINSRKNYTVSNAYHVEEKTAESYSLSIDSKALDEIIQANCPDARRVVYLTRRKNNEVRQLIRSKGLRHGLVYNVHDDLIKDDLVHVLDMICSYCETSLEDMLYLYRTSPQSEGIKDPSSTAGLDLVESKSIELTLLTEEEDKEQDKKMPALSEDADQIHQALLKEQSKFKSWAPVKLRNVKNGLRFGVNSGQFCGKLDIVLDRGKELFKVYARDSSGKIIRKQYDVQATHIHSACEYVMGIR